MRELCGRVLFLSTIVAVATFVGTILEIVSIDQTWKLLFVSTAIALGAKGCGVAVEWFTPEEPR